MLKVLIVGMTENPGGMESFVLNYLQKFDKTKLQFDFLSNTMNNIAYEDIFELMNCKMYHIPSFGKSPLKNKIELHRFFKKNAGKYDAIWVHLNNLANIDYLKLAKKYNIPRRIIHSHNSKHMETGVKGAIKRFYHKKNQMLLKYYATDYWACSEGAATFFYEDIHTDKVQIIPNAIDVAQSKFNQEARNKLRNQNNIAPSTFVLGNVGRLQYQKNQEFMLEVFRDFQNISKDSRLILVGDGPDKEMLIKKTNDYNLRDKVIFTGVQSNISEWLSTFDVFFFPSRFEGLGIAALEAQANGLPVITSTSVTKKVNVTDLTTFLDLDAPISSWVDVLLSVKNNDKRLNGDLIIQKFIEKHFEISIEVKRVQKLLLGEGE
ncbi:glycosyltransferase family 1 protein [Streptococcus sp. UBA4344]|uniref:glycosyltransferase family 1 protein n=1 Tax=Streptococcus sp. UBA4344 TaxID=1947564 RepID=UPI00257C2DEA|nr:glycosyltransferase family 1 protein [Streptococcus sp. UBA4344]